jgi:hypothetical protein
MGMLRILIGGRLTLVCFGGQAAGVEQRRGLALGGFFTLVY